MRIYSPQRKAIYLSPNRLDLLHRRRGLSDQQNGCMVCAVQGGKVSWQEFADWLSARGFRVEKARPPPADSGYHRLSSAARYFR